MLWLGRPLKSRVIAHVPGTRPDSVVSRWGVGANLGRSGPVAPTGQGLPGRADDAAMVLAIIIEHAAAVG